MSGEKSTLPGKVFFVKVKNRNHYLFVTVMLYKSLGYTGCFEELHSKLRTMWYSSEAKVLINMSPYVIGFIKHFRDEPVIS